MTARPPIAVIAALILAASASPASAGVRQALQSQALQHLVPHGPDPIRPDPQKTPGAVLTSDAKAVCYPGYSKTVRHTSGDLKHQVYQSYGLSNKTGHYEIDHLVPLSIGGADVRDNLWPQSYDTTPWNAHVKDRLEWKVLHLVCNGKVPMAQVQQDIAQDWIAAYQKYCPTEADCPSYEASHKGKSHGDDVD